MKLATRNFPGGHAKTSRRYPRGAPQFWLPQRNPRQGRVCFGVRMRSAESVPGKCGTVIAITGRLPRLGYCLKSRQISSDLMRYLFAFNEIFHGSISCESDRISWNLVNLLRQGVFGARMAPWCSQESTGMVGFRRRILFSLCTDQLYFCAMTKSGESQAKNVGPKWERRWRDGSVITSREPSAVPGRRRLRRFLPARRPRPLPNAVRRKDC